MQRSRSRDMSHITYSGVTAEKMHLHDGFRRPMLEYVTRRVMIGPRRKSVREKKIFQSVEVDDEEVGLAT